MSEVFSGKLRAIGSSVGLLVPKKQMDSLNLKEGEEVDVALLKHRTIAEIEMGFGMAKKFKHSFERDKKTREF